MNTLADKTQEKQSLKRTSESTKKESKNKSTFQMVDNRPETIVQRKLKALANKNPETELASRLHSMANPNFTGQTQPIQKKPNNTGLPDNLKSGLENLSGYSLDDVNVHLNSNKPAQLQAHAFASGTDIHVASGQEKHLPHEAWHVVQQKQGRVKPTFQTKEKVAINDDVQLEHEADVMGQKALNGGNKNYTTAQKSLASKNHDEVLQGYFIGAATASTSTTVAEGQDRQADNSFRDPTDVSHKQLATSGNDPSTANSLKISEDGKIAIENVNDDRQAKVFFAEAKIISKSNKILLSKGSKYILQVKTASAITVDDAKGKSHTLDAIEPVLNPDQGKKSDSKKIAATVGTQPHGNAVEVEATCIAVAEAIINKKYGMTADMNINFKKMGILTTVEATQWSAAVADAMTKNGKRVNGPLNQDAIAQAYGQFVNANPVAAAKIAKKLGINEFASPKVGEAYISESVGNPGAGGITNWLVDQTGNTDTALMANDATVRGGKKRTGWGNHAGAVVASSGGNNITMENYARSGEDEALKADDNIFYFAMYGPASKPTQTWHAKWSGGATPIANAVTGVLK